MLTGASDNSAKNAMVLFGSRAEINEVFDTFSDANATNPSDVAKDWNTKPVAYSDVESDTEQVNTDTQPAAISIQSDSTSQRTSVVKV